MEGSEQQRGGRVAALVVVVLILVPLSGWAALVGLIWGFGLKCDDSCGSPPPWREDADAWQWSALGLSGVGLLVLSVVLAVAVAVRLRGLVRVAAAAWFVVGLAFLTLLSGAGLA